MSRRVLLMLLVCLLLQVTARASDAPPARSLVIDDFETEESLWNWGRWLSDDPGLMELSAEHVSHGGRSLKVTMPEAAEEKTAYGIHTFALPRDWSEFESLRFDVHYDCPSGTAQDWLGLSVYIDDVESAGWATNFHQENWRLRPGWNYKQIDVDDIARRRDRIDTTRVKVLYFIMSRRPEPTALSFDHVRLEPRQPRAPVTGTPGLLAIGPSDTNKTDRVTVTCPGQFALDFDPNVGTVARWFDLSRDPDRRTNLVAEYSRLLNNKFGFKDEEGKPVGGSSYLAPTEVPVLLEASPVRARVRLVCPGARTYGGGAVQTNVQGTTDYTVYPTGRVFIRNQLRVVGEPYRSNHFQLNMLTSWAAHNGSNGQAIRSSAKDFILHTHRGGEVAADALLVWHTGERPTSYFNAPYERVFYRSGLQLTEAGNQHLEPGSSLTWCLMLQLQPDTIDSEEAARPYALDYRAPARVSVARGALITDDAGDLNQDGFNEAEGCYVLWAEDGSADFTLASGEVTHYWPILKVLNWPGEAPASITVDDRELSTGSDFLAHADASVLIIQLLKPVSGDAVFSVAGN